MNENASAPKAASTPSTPDALAVARRAALREKHAQGLARLMDERRDLRGVLPLADFVDDALRWSA